jgi:hypothetical protein
MATKGETMTRGKTAAIAASREATKAQTAPGEDYKKEQAAKREAGRTWGGGAGKGQLAAIKKDKRKKRIAKMKAFTAKLRSKRSPMKTF